MRAFAESAQLVQAGEPHLPQISGVDLGMAGEDSEVVVNRFRVQPDR